MEENSIGPFASGALITLCQESIGYSLAYMYAKEELGNLSPPKNPLYKLIPIYSEELSAKEWLRFFSEEMPLPDNQISDAIRMTNVNIDLLNSCKNFAVLRIGLLFTAGVTLELVKNNISHDLRFILLGYISTYLAANLYRLVKIDEIKTNSKNFIEKMSKIERKSRFKPRKDL